MSTTPGEELADFEALFLADLPLIDTRSPGEFERGSFPMATNLPLMSNEERAAVGTCYKEQGQDAAIALGHSLVCGDSKEQRVERWAAFVASNPHGALFCWRGGLRSQITQQWLADRGIHYPRIRGGYKALRRWLLDEFAALCEPQQLLVVGGKTGCAKTRILNAGYQQGPFPGRIDLEGLANHRGSAFGRRLGGQPTQLQFEIALAIEFVKASRRQTGPLMIEDEGRLIGRCALPPSLFVAKNQAPLVMVETSLEERVEHSFDNYILANLTDLLNAGTDPEQAFSAFSESLLTALDKLKKRLGGVRHQDLRRQLQDALKRHEAGDPSDHKRWIRTLLAEYYDPMYNYQLAERLERVVFRGEPTEVIDYLRSVTLAGAG